MINSQLFAFSTPIIMKHLLIPEGENPDGMNTCELSGVSSFSTVQHNIPTNKKSMQISRSKYRLMQISRTKYVILFLTY